MNLTPEQRRARHITAVCPSCGADLLLDEHHQYGYGSPSLHRGYECPWCGAELLTTAIVVVLEVKAPEEPATTVSAPAPDMAAE